MPTKEERNEHGRFEAKHGVTAPDLFEIMEPFEPYTTRELANKLDIPRRTAYKYLEELNEDGEVRKKKPGPRRVIWIAVTEHQDN
jgi:Fic family protein